MIKAFVTGATGFIGSALCRALLEAGYEVRAFHRPTSNLLLIKDLPVEYITGDLSQPESLRRAMQGVQVVFHTAALMGGGRGDASRHYTVTVEGTRAVLRAALECGVERLIHTSSVAALGVPPQIPGNQNTAYHMNETHTWNYLPERWPYGYAKYLAELEVQRAVASGLDVVILNPTLVIGAGDLYRQSRSVVVQVVQGRLPVIVEGGLNVISLKDTVAGHLAALQRGRCGERYILAGQNLTVAQLIERIAELGGVPPPRTLLPAGLVRRLGGLYRLFENWLPLPVSSSELYLAGRYFYFDAHKARIELKWACCVDTDQAIREAIHWSKEKGMLAP
ncbi:MAG: NAD-dependent epimerase/dehydratase family protein [Chloroflexota bacterium]